MTATVSGSQRQPLCASAGRRAGCAHAAGEGLHRSLIRTLARSPGPSRLLTQRRHSSGWRLSAPTSGRRCQQRTHFGIGGWRATPPTRPASRCSPPPPPPPAARGVSCTRASEVMRRKRSSSPSAAKRAYSAGAQYTSTRASSGAPIAPRVAQLLELARHVRAQRDERRASRSSSAGTSGSVMPGVVKHRLGALARQVAATSPRR